MKQQTKYMLLALVIGFVAYWLVKLAIYGKQRMESPFKYFSWSEFDSPDAPGSGKANMDIDFVRKLDQVRACAGFPFLINSGYRTQEHNRSVGGVENSSHRKGLAVDIRAVVAGIDRREEIALCAIQNGITRIGWGKTFIHLDVDPDKTPNIVWGKYHYGTNPPTFNELQNNLA